MANPSIVICECFARDGLQHETTHVSTGQKIRLIDAFTTAGFPRIEATSYSHPGRIPVFADANDVLAGITRRQGVWYKATCPNLKAVERAIEDLDAGHGANELSLLVSATEAHTARNLRTTRAAQWKRVREMAATAGPRFRLVGVISVALGCPFEGDVDPAIVSADVLRFAELGVGIVAIGDTTGLATPSRVRAMFEKLKAEAPKTTLVAHFHDTRGTGIANAVAAYEAGCRYFDTSFGGVGGHPVTIAYGGGRTGNVATEDLVNLFESEGISTGIDLDRMMEASRLCEETLGRTLDSKVARAGLGPMRHKGKIDV
jgi:hydroxymethylglutaryl-CoA lyase